LSPVVSLKIEVFAFRSETLSIPNRGDRDRTVENGEKRGAKRRERERERVRTGMVVAGKTEMLEMTEKGWENEEEKEIARREHFRYFIEARLFSSSAVWSLS